MITTEICEITSFILRSYMTSRTTGSLSFSHSETEGTYRRMALWPRVFPAWRTTTLGWYILTCVNSSSTVVSSLHRAKNLTLPACNSPVIFSWTLFLTSSMRTLRTFSCGLVVMAYNQGNCLGVSFLISMFATLGFSLRVVAFSLFFPPAFFAFLPSSFSTLILFALGGATVIGPFWEEKLMTTSSSLFVPIECF